MPASAADLADGGPIADPVCCGASIADAIAGSGLQTELRTDGNPSVWVAPVNRCGYRADVLLIPESAWIPDDIRQALTAACREGDDPDA